MGRLPAMIVLVLAAAAAVGGAADGGTLTWMESDFPPVVIHSGPLEGKGYQDVIQDILKENLPEYRHLTLVGNMKRMYHEFKKGSHVCNGAFYKTRERETFLHFSIPTTFTLPTRLILKKGTWVRLGGEKRAALAEVLSEPELTLGVAANRSYGVPIDAVLDKYRGGGKLFVYSGDDLFENLLKMLVAGRLDGILGLPEEVVYMGEKLRLTEEIVSVSLVENEGEYHAWLGYLVAPKNAWGKALVEKVDRILLRERPTERYRKAYERWLDVNSREVYRALYDEVFLGIDGPR